MELSRFRSVPTATAWDVARRLLAAVLLVAAGLKAYELAYSPPLVRPGLLGQHWLFAVAMELELALGGWLLVGSAGRRTWTVTLLVWLAFFGVSSYEVAGGATTCGCFGEVHVKPVYTASFDLVTVIALVLCRPRHGRPSLSTPLPAWRWSPVVIAALGGGVLIAWCLVHWSRRTPNDEGITMAGGITILEPRKWEGHSFPLVDSLDAGPSLMAGEWLVVLYRSDCGHCQRAVPRYEDLALRNRVTAAMPGVALVEMPPYAKAGHEIVRADSPAIRQKLSDKREWFAKTPVVLKLVAGNVVAVAEGEQAEDPAFIMGEPVTH